jgi:hypothetical protein
MQAFVAKHWGGDAGSVEWLRPAGLSSDLHSISYAEGMMRYFCPNQVRLTEFGQAFAGDERLD